MRVAEEEDGSYDESLRYLMHCSSWPYYNGMLTERVERGSGNSTIAVREDKILYFSGLCCGRKEALGLVRGLGV